MAIKIKCIICEEEIEKPKIGQLCCNRKKCRDEFNSNMIELWKLENNNKTISKKQIEKLYN